MSSKQSQYLIDYNKIAAIYARNRAASSIVVDELISQCKGFHDAKVLEVGCGAGSYIFALTNAIDCQGWGLDPSPAMLNCAPKQKRIK